MFLVFPTTVFAAPYLVSDPVDPASCGGTDQPTCPVSFTVYEDGTAIANEIAVEADMSIKFDLDGRPPGNHRYTAIYHDEFGGISLVSNPTQLGPLAPSGMRLSP